MFRMEVDMHLYIGVDLHKTQFTVYAKQGNGLYGKV